MSDLKLELVVHPLCPYAQRALYTASFKSIPAEIINTSTAQKEPWFLELNPKGEVPSLRITKDGQIYKLTESLNISEYFDSFPGPSLYPRLPDGTIDPLQKCIIDLFIQRKIPAFVSNLYFFWVKPEEKVNAFKASVEDISNHVEGGNYILHKVLGRNEITFADVMIFSFVERFSAYRDEFPEEFKVVDFSPILTYYEKLSSEPWAQQHKADPKRLVNLVRSVREHGYKGLSFPLTVYD
jgi:glutathione S-transferase